MQTPGPPPPTTLRDSLPADPFGDAVSARPPVYGSLRLQPVMLGPPPDGGAGDVTAADDIDPTELSGKPRTGLVAGIMAALTIGATVGAAWWTLRPQDEQAVPPIPVVQPAMPPAAPAISVAPPAPAEAPAPQSSAQAAPSQPVDMARIDSELIPPTTEGLSPARRIQTLRILVENDQEIIAPR